MSRKGVADGLTVEVGAHCFVVVETIRVMHLAVRGLQTDARAQKAQRRLPVPRRHAAPVVASSSTAGSPATGSGALGIGGNRGGARRSRPGDASAHETA
eukprot:7381274-Prymnesium_polylepis.4